MSSPYKTAARRFGTPLYVYDARILKDRCQALRKNFPKVAIHYAMKANSNLALLRIIRSQGIGIEAVSRGEIEQAKKAGFTRDRISFTCASLEAKELAYAARNAKVVHLDSLTQLTHWGRRKLGKTVSLRVNQGIGSGHHNHTITGGPGSKFGITLNDLPKARALAKRYGLRITGLQQHIGSGILSADIFMEGVEALLKLATTFDSLERIDFGGGLGIPYRPSQTAWDLTKLGARFKRAITRFETTKGKKLEYAFEPGRYIVAESGSLIVSVVDEKKTANHHFIGVNSGFNHLIRPAMYGSYHEIENLSRTGGTKGDVSIAGNVCESGDLFAVERKMPVPRIGELLRIKDAGAYGMSMASRYNLRPLTKEIVINSRS